MFARTARLASPLVLVSVLAFGWPCSPVPKAAAQQAQAGVGKISQEQASQNALQALPGKVTDISIERKRGKSVYVVEIVADKNGEETDVLVDMESGKVLGFE
jgi:uncharacterized membrane protein YkoI